MLVVDHLPEARDLVRMQLSLEDHLEVVGEAADGHQAVAEAARLQPDLVVLDITMPRLDGFRTIPLIRQLARATKIVVLSSYSSLHDMELAMSLGASAFIVKGTPRRGVVEAVNAALDLPV